MGEKHGSHHGHSGAADSAALHDPVCGMTVGPETAHRFIHAGTAYLFCSAGCLAKFRESPGRYLSAEGGGEPSRQEESAEGKIVREAEYTCPMHPEVVRDAPGDCPICGMALEPRTVSAEEEENAELVDMRKRFRASAVLTVPLFLVAMADILPGRPLENLASPRTLGWLEFALGTPVVLWGGWPFFVKAWRSIANRSLNMFTLIGLGVGVAYLYSLVAALFPYIFPASFSAAA